MAQELGNSLEQGGRDSLRAAQGAKGAVDTGKAAVKGAKKTVRAARKGAKYAAKAAKAGAKAAGSALKAIFSNPYTAAAAIVIIFLLLAFAYAKTATSNVQLEETYYVTSLGVDIEDRNRPEYETKEELQTILFDQDRAKEETINLLSVLHEQKAKDREDSLEKALKKIAQESGYDIELDMSRANTRYDMPYGTNYINGLSAALVGSYDVVGVAEQYLGMGLNEVKSAMRSKNFTLFSPGYAYEWCAWFVSNVFYEAGYSDIITPSTWAKDVGRNDGVFIPGSNHTPAPGDIIYFGTSAANVLHVGLVKSCDGTNIVTVEGNAGPGGSWSLRKCVSKTYAVGTSRIIGYSHIPLKESNLANAANFDANGISNKTASDIAKFLMDKGLNAAATCGILGNLERESGFSLSFESEDGGIGLASWKGGRKAKLKSKYSDWSANLTSQLEYLWEELSGSQKSVLDYLLTVPNTEKGMLDSADYFCRSFLSSGNYEEEVPIRKNLSSVYFSETGGNVTGSALSVVPGATSEDFKVLSAFSVGIGNSELRINKDGEPETLKGIPLSRNWDLRDFFNSSFGQKSYEATLKSKIKSFLNNNSFYTVTFATNEDGSNIFSYTTTEQAFVADTPVYKEEPEESNEEAPPFSGGGSQVRPGPNPIAMEYLIETKRVSILSKFTPKRDTLQVGEIAGPTGGEVETDSGTLMLEEGQIVTEDGTVGHYEDVEVYHYYVKPIVKEKTLDEILEPLFGINKEDPFTGSMYDKDGDGIIDDATATIKNGDAIEELAKNTCELLGIDPGSATSTTIGAYGSGMLGMPLPPGKYQLGYGFGPRTAFMTNSGQMSSSNHKGIDIPCAANTPIFAAAGGTVTGAGWMNGGGNGVVIDHGNGLKTVYYHMITTPIVKTGDTVVRGQKIGFVGSTGNSTGPHLHFEVWESGSAVDPQPFIGINVTKGQTFEIKEASQNTTWTGAKLNKVIGTIQGPSGKETYYNLPMQGVIKLMRSLGYSERDYKYWVREDGCKMFGDYIMVAANLSLRPKGTIVETSLGFGIVCDTDPTFKSTEIDIAVNW